ncbi:hypothetical protein DCI69_07565 [Salmonella enterica subsp. enterica serovar Kentucky]|nr:hypothetical protein [Salmonella enterica subsp. enterica serovar Kentucky]
MARRSFTIFKQGINFGLSRLHYFNLTDYVSSGSLLNIFMILFFYRNCLIDPTRVVWTQP